MLASVEDLSIRLGRELDIDDEVRSYALLEDASAAVRSYTGQQFTLGTTTKSFKVRCGKLRLSQRPVVGVSSVQVGGVAIPFTAMAQDVVVAPGVAVVEVTYIHGYEVIPQEIKAIVCQIAARALGVHPEQGGVTQESVEGYSYTLGVIGAAGAFGFLNDERAVLDRYRRPASSITMA